MPTVSEPVRAPKKTYQECISDAAGVYANWLATRGAQAAQSAPAPAAEGKAAA